MSASTARGFTVLRRFFNALQRAGLFSARTFAHHRPARFDFHNASGVYADRLDAATCSDRRSRSICFLKFAGNSRSSSNNSRSRSPIFLTIARLCRESMSTEFRITFLPAKTRKHGQLTQTKKERDRRLGYRVRALVFFKQFLESGSERPLAIRDTRRSLTAGDGLARQVTGEDFRSAPSEYLFRLPF